jgi:hypothetical protein
MHLAASAAGRRLRVVRGQSLVEMALILPLFLLIVFGSIDVGLLVFGHSTLSQAAREGARVGAVEAYWIGRGNPLSPTYDPSCNQPGGPVCPADLTAFRADVLAATNRMLVPFGPIPDANLYTSCDASIAPTGAWTTQTCGTTSSGGLVSVRVVLRFTPITPIISQLIPTIEEEASATMVIN